MLKRLFSFLIFSTVTLTVVAQEVWLEPLKFIYTPADSLKVNFMEGVDFIGQSLKAMEMTGFQDEIKTAVSRMTLHHQNSVTDIDKYFRGDKHEGLAVPPQLEGTYIIAMETPGSFRELESEKFNIYLKEAALDDAYYQRQKTNSLDKSGKEIYAHLAKVLVQVGKRTDDTFKKQTGLALEIIPQQNPYSLKVGDRVQFKIMYDGKPLFGARVKVWNRHNNRTSVQNIFTEQNGLIETHISNPGAWMVSVVKMIPSEGPQADWQSFKGTLVFGVK